ncbi:MAG: glycosyltransferase [Burkholderiaceae bacterium]
MLTIGIIGTRGIPNSYGGFERFAELLVAESVWQGHNVQFIVYGEGPDRTYNAWTQLRNVGILKNERPLLYFIESARPATRECDIILCCSIGLSFFAFWPVLRGRALVVNPDGCEWRRTKWSWLGRWLIRAMYPPSFAAATRIVIDAEALRADFGRALGNKARYIGYQAPEPQATPLLESTRSKWALNRPFVLIVARLEPENNIQLILQAFRELPQSKVDLIVVGGTTTKFYAKALAPLSTAHVRFVGAIYDQEVLNELRSNCIAYVHGHSVGGTNPSLLEALATVRGHLMCHDNKYNREVAAGEAEYFADEHQLVELLRPLMQPIENGAPVHRAPSRDERFRPDTIARRYLELFEEIRAVR